MFFDGKQIIANDTSYLDKIDVHHVNGQRVIYVAGEGVIREVTEHDFQMTYNHYFSQAHRFIDFKVQRLYFIPHYWHL